MQFSVEFFDTFAKEYQDILKHSIKSSTMDDDMQFALDLQRDRLSEKDLVLETSITPRGHFPGGQLARNWSDGMYRNHMDIRTCNWDRKILRGGKQVFHDRLDKTLYITATDLIFGAKNVEKETYTCPNCGNVTTIGELREGCPYCGTHFEMQELYPRVGGLYYVKEIGGTEKEVKKDVMRYMIPVIVAFGIFGLITVLFAEDRGSIVWLLQSIFMMAFTLGVGAFVGYMIWAILKLGSIFYEAGKALPSLPGVLGSRKKFETRMKELSPDFSYDYFANKVGTLVKMMIFSPDPALLPICVGDHMENPFQDVVDAQFRGPVIMKSFKMDGNTVHVRADAEFDLLLTKGSVFWKKRQFIPLYMSRDCSMRFRTNYSVKKVSCRNCGGSFDATRKDRCPYCGTEYDIRKEDWYITGFSQK